MHHTFHVQRGGGRGAVHAFTEKGQTTAFDCHSHRERVWHCASQQVLENRGTHDRPIDLYCLFASCAPVGKIICESVGCCFSYIASCTHTGEIVLCLCDIACCYLSWPSSGQWFDLWSPAHFLSFASLAICGQFAARICDCSNLVRFPNLIVVHFSRCRVRRSHARHNDAPFFVHSRRLSRTVFSPGPQCAFACLLHPRSVANDLSTRGGCTDGHMWCTSE